MKEVKEDMQDYKKEIVSDDLHTIFKGIMLL